MKAIIKTSGFVNFAVTIQHLEENENSMRVPQGRKTGSKSQVWKRLKQAVSANKLKDLVEISKGLEMEFSREPKGEKQPQEPTEEERRKHELTHLPKADWCTSCQATRSREDNFDVSEKTNEASLVTMDFKFTGTRDEENKKESKDALTIGLVMVDQATKFVRVIPVRFQAKKLQHIWLKKYAEC